MAPLSETAYEVLVSPNGALRTHTAVAVRCRSENFIHLFGVMELSTSDVVHSRSPGLDCVRRITCAANIRGMRNSRTTFYDRLGRAKRSELA